MLNDHRTGRREIRAPVRKANHFKPTPEILYILKQWVNDYITRKNKMHTPPPHSKQTIPIILSFTPYFVLIF